MRKKSAMAAAAFVLTLGFVTSSQASWASGEGYRLSHGSSTTRLVVEGSGTWVGSYGISHYHNLENICQYKGKVWGTLTTGAHHSWTSAYNSGCTPLAWARERNGISYNFKLGTNIYGQAYEGTAWQPGIPTVAIQ